MEYANIYPIIYYVAGLNSCLMFIVAYYILSKKYSFRFQRIYAYILIFWGLQFLTTLLYDYKHYDHYNHYINTLLLTFDFWAIGGFIILLIELLHPNKHTYPTLLLVILPFALFSLSYAIFKSNIIYQIEQYAILVVCITTYIVMEVKIKRYNLFLAENHSDLEKTHLKWISNTLKVLLVLFLIWLTISFSLFLIIYIIYNILIFAFIIYLSNKILHHRLPIKFDINYLNQQSNPKFNQEYFSSLDIESIIKDNQYYLEADLCLDRLALLLGTNRSYLSNYINRSLNTTFYEYINMFRLDYAMEMIKDKNNNLSLEGIAYKSGFKSYSTFNNSFKHKYKITPGAYRQKYIIT